MTRHNWLMPLVLALTLSLGLAGTAVAQVTGAVRGVVLDDQGAAIPGALVALRQPSSGLERVTTTDGLGRFLLPNLPLGSHDVTAELSGFQPRSQRVELTTAVPVELSLTLALAPVTDIVTVRPVSAAIDTSSAGTRHAVSITRIERHAGGGLEPRPRGGAGRVSRASRRTPTAPSIRAAPTTR